MLLSALFCICCIFNIELLMIKVNGFRSVLNRAKFVSLKRSSFQVRDFTNPAGNSAFKPFVVDKDSLLSTLKKFGTDIRENSDGQYSLKECKLCVKGNRDKPDNLYKLNVWPSGSYNCLRCSCHGGWRDLQQKASQFQEPSDQVKVFQVQSGAPAPAKEPGQSPTYTIPNQSAMYRSFSNLFPNDTRLNARKESDLEIARRKQVLDYLHDVRGLNDEVLQKYGVGFTVSEFLSTTENKWEEKVCITFPWQVPRSYLDGKNYKFTQPTDDSNDRDPIIVRMKSRALETKGLQRILPKGGMWGFFGWHTVPPLIDTSDHTTANNTTVASAASTTPPREIIITEGEYDAMAVSQMLALLPEDDLLRHVPVVSLPNGCNSLPTDLIPLLDPYTKIYLWLDDDKSGQEASSKFVAKLGAHRCAIVKPLPESANPPKDANDALRQGDPLLVPNMLRAAEVTKQELYTSFAVERAFVMPRVSRTDLRDGSQTTSLPLLSKICKGFRRGELVILTGPTGSGKTTLLSQLGLDFAQQGRPVLWGSFEIKNRQLMAKMVQQSHKASKLNDLSSTMLDQVANDFEALPIKFLNFHGATKIDDVIAGMDAAVYRDDVQHIIIDNLQFMVPLVSDAESSSGSASSSSAYEKFNVQDAIIHKLRRFATEKDVNIVLVIHPRKEDENVKLTMSSIFGTAKATQEADLVLILQRLYERTFLEVKKNRYDGETGKVDLEFNSRNTCYEDSSYKTPDQEKYPKKKITSGGSGIAEETSTVAATTAAPVPVTGGTSASTSSAAAVPGVAPVQEKEGPVRRTTAAAAAYVRTRPSRPTLSATPVPVSATSPKTATVDAAAVVVADIATPAVGTDAIAAPSEAAPVTTTTPAKRSYVSAAARKLAQAKLAALKDEEAPIHWGNELKQAAAAPEPMPQPGTQTLPEVVPTAETGDNSSVAQSKPTTTGTSYSYKPRPRVVKKVEG